MSPFPWIFGSISQYENSVSYFLCSRNSHSLSSPFASDGVAKLLTTEKRLFLGIYKRFRLFIHNIILQRCVPELIVENGRISVPWFSDQVWSRDHRCRWHSRGPKRSTAGALWVVYNLNGTMSNGLPEANSSCSENDNTRSHDSFVRSCLEKLKGFRQVPDCRI